jgi:hypothetical protein
MRVARRFLRRSGTRAAALRRFRVRVRSCRVRDEASQQTPSGLESEFQIDRSIVNRPEKCKGDETRSEREEKCTGCSTGRARRHYPERHASARVEHGASLTSFLPDKTNKNPLKIC